LILKRLVIFALLLSACVPLRLVVAPSLYVSQTGGGTTCSESSPCTFATAATKTETNIIVLGTITNSVTWNRSGTALSPVTISGGVFSAPLSPIGVYALKINGAYVNVVGVTVTGAQEAGVWLNGGYGSVRDSDISNAGLGVKVTSANNLVTNNRIHDLHMVKNTVGGNDDFGAVGVMLNNASNNEVSHNEIIRCKAPSFDYGFDGGTVEWWGKSDNNYVHHNYAEDNDSFSEIGGGSANNGRLEYNISINSGRFVAMHLGGTFASAVNGFVVKNNTVVQVDHEWAVIGFVGTAPTSATLNVTNNIFVMNADIFANYLTFAYMDNVYWGAFRTFALHSGDRIVDPLFTSDYHLKTGSPAAGAGAYPEPLLPPTLTPTITPSPTATYTPTITPSPTPTSTPTPTPICIELWWDGTWGYCQ